MPRRTAPLLLAVPLLWAFAPAPKPKEGADDAKAIQGDWKVARLEREGKPEREAEKELAKVVIKGDRMEIHEGKRVEAVKLVLDPKKKPKEITLTVDRGPGAPKGPPLEPPIPGIYKLEKDTLTICFSRGGRDARPKEFVTTPGSGHSLIVFQRVKP